MSSVVRRAKMNARWIEDNPTNVVEQRERTINANIVFSFPIKFLGALPPLEGERIAAAPPPSLIC